ncbi:MAG: hypothetical protein ABJ327_03605 [Litoreibacter sp.]
MSDGVPVSAIVDFLVSDGAASFPLNNKQINVRFQAGYGVGAGDQTEDAMNVIVTINEFARSPKGSDLLSDWDGTTININITDDPNGAGSGGREMFGVGVVNVNTSQIDFQYRTADGKLANFNIQGIVNHELVHVLTGLDDGLTHNEIVNIINAQTNGGPPRSNDYNDIVAPDNHCFKSDTAIQMWPLDLSIRPGVDGRYDEAFVLSKVWEKPISEIAVGDLVVSYDAEGFIKPGPVTRTMLNSATHILDFWGTGVTPGHAYYCADGKFESQHVPLMDILRTDGAVKRADGTLIRAATNAEVGSMGDMMIHAAATMQKPDGTWTPMREGKLRFGTRIILPDGRDMSFMEMAQSEGWKVTDDGYMVASLNGEDGALHEQTFVFPYAHGEELPKPEEYILARSEVTLEAIYAAGEWEQIGTRMAAPESMVGLNTRQAAFLWPPKPKPNIPPSFAGHPDAPLSSELKESQDPLNAMKVH